MLDAIASLPLLLFLSGSIGVGTVAGLWVGRTRVEKILIGVLTAGLLHFVSFGAFVVYSFSHMS